MIAIGHLAAGSIIGNVVVNYTQDPVKGVLLGLACGLASHYILDTVPHGHFDRKAEYTKISLTTILIYLDFIGGSFLFFYLAFSKFGFSNNLFVVLFSIFGAILPDMISAVDKLFFGQSLRKGLLKGEYSFHSSTHWHGKGTKTLLMSLKDLWQVALIVLAFFI